MRRTESSPRRQLNGWAITAAVGALVALIGAFMPLLSVGPYSLSGSDVRVGNATPWSVSDRNTITLLLERRDLAIILILWVITLAGLCAVGRWTRWAAGLGVIIAAAVFHLLLNMIQRAETVGLQTDSDVTYSLGAFACLAGALLSLVGFVVVLARRN